MTTRRQFATTLAALTAGAIVGGRSRAYAEGPLRMAFSIDSLAGVNVNDARAAYKVWESEVIEKFGLKNMEFYSDIFYPSAQILQMIRSRQIECFTLTTLEYASILNFANPEEMVLVSEVANGVDYLLLVHQDSRFHTIEDLKSAKLLMHHHRDTTLLKTWLNVKLAEMGQRGIDQFFASAEMRDKLNEVILPVFFRNADAGAISRRVFDIAVELNPQLGRQLRIVATSPKVIPVGIWFLKDCDPETMREVMNVVTKFGSIPAGRQILALYQSSRLVQCPCSVMSDSLKLVRQSERLHQA
ncbi:MAG TPA: PhnD/SsuA/transferrin family substrate-binding protein [Terracidiphilus sp.]|nr:PhnD/SsuA/transferrin family substrate-binding protein [Terracidiphilus sp.]